MRKLVFASGLILVVIGGILLAVSGMQRNWLVVAIGGLICVYGLFAKGARPLKTSARGITRMTTKTLALREPEWDCDAMKARTKRGQFTIPFFQKSCF